jgi:hypothetical protein
MAMKIITLLGERLRVAISSYLKERLPKRLQMKKFWLKVTFYGKACLFTLCTIKYNT